MGTHPSAVVSPLAEIGRDVEIGPFCVVEPGVRLGDGCRLQSRVVIRQGTTLGRDNYVAEGAVLGGMPYYLAAFDDAVDLWDNIHAQILDQRGLLYNEPQLLFMEELREPRNYFSRDSCLKTIESERLEFIPQSQLR